MRDAGELGARRQVTRLRFPGLGRRRQRAMAVLGSVTADNAILRLLEFLLRTLGLRFFLLGLLFLLGDVFRRRWRQLRDRRAGYQPPATAIRSLAMDVFASIR